MTDRTQRDALVHIAAEEIRNAARHQFLNLEDAQKISKFADALQYGWHMYPDKQKEIIEKHTHHVQCFSVTPWFPKKVSPVRPGVYQVLLENSYKPQFAYFSGYMWFAPSGNIETADAIEQWWGKNIAPWRGLTERNGHTLT